MSQNAQFFHISSDRQVNPEIALKRRQTPFLVPF